MRAKEEELADIICDLSSDMACPELPSRECVEDFSVIQPSDVGSACGTQSGRRKRPDPTRLSSKSSVVPVLPNQSHLTDPV